MPFSGLFARASLALCLVCQSVPATARESRTTHSWVEQGRTLSPEQASRLEERLQRKPKDEEARIQLLSFYSSPAGAALPSAKAARLSHILWIVDADPSSGLGLFELPTAIHRLNCQADPIADPLADPDHFPALRDLWIKKVSEKPKSAQIRREAVAAIHLCEPEAAEKILLAAGDRLGLGEIYGSALLGVSAVSYPTKEPLAATAAVRSGPFADKARQALENSPDSELLAGAAIAILSNGPILWSEGKLDWDYTTIGKPLLNGAKLTKSSELALSVLSTSLPKAGERPPAVVFFRDTLYSKTVSAPFPKFPPAASRARKEGTVKMKALIGLRGEIIQVLVEEGGAEFVAASLEAIRQWQFEPMIIGGKACYVQTPLLFKFWFQR